MYFEIVMANSIVKPFKTVVNLSYKILGMGTTEMPKPPIFMLHGIIGHKEQLTGIGKTILNMTRRTVVVVDQRNHGDSPHTNSHKYTDQAADVLDLFERLGARQATLVGYGMGGRTAMAVALTAPEQVAGLLVMDVSPISTPPEYKASILKLLQGMKAVDFKKANALSKAVAEARLQLKKFNTNESIMSLVVSNIRRKPDGAFGWICNVDVLLKHFKHWIVFPEKYRHRVYDGPTRFIGGQVSDFIPPDELNMIRMMFPRAVITYIKSAGHCVYLDDPKSCLELIIPFIRTHHFSNIQ